MLYQTILLQVSVSVIFLLSSVVAVAWIIHFTLSTTQISSAATWRMILQASAYIALLVVFSFGTIIVYCDYFASLKKAPKAVVLVAPVLCRTSHRMQWTPDLMYFAVV
jgi:hypothetical protein